MKKIEAIIRKSKFKEVKEALHNVEVNFFSYWDVSRINKEKSFAFSIVIPSIVFPKNAEISGNT